MKKRTKVIIGVIVALVIIAAIGGGASGNKEQATVEPSVIQEEVKAESANETVETTTESNEVTSTTEAEEPEAVEPVDEEAESVPAEEEEETLLHGELLEVNNSDGVVVIKAKIKPSSSNKTTVDQNYYNVEDYVKNHNMEGVTEIQYWAVADMQNGEEDKVISFTVPADLITRILEGKYATNQMGNDVEELWIHPSLK